MFSYANAPKGRPNKGALFSCGQRGKRRGAALRRAAAFFDKKE